MVSCRQDFPRVRRFPGFKGCGGGELWLQFDVAGVLPTICQAAVRSGPSQFARSPSTLPVKPTVVVSLADRSRGFRLIGDHGDRHIKLQRIASEVFHGKVDGHPTANAARRLDTVLPRLVAAAHGRCLRRSDRASPMRELLHRTRSPEQMTATSLVQSRRNYPARVGLVKHAIGAR